MKRLSFCFLASMISTCVFAEGSAALPTAPAHTAQAQHRVLLFDHGDMGSKFWRIPALAVTNSGTVIAAADKRNDSNRDLPNDIDIVIRRSVDSGRTWDDQRIILPHDDEGGYGDPAIGVHRPSGTIVLVAAHGNGVWESTPDNHTRVTVTRSTDDGMTWSDPVDITSSLYEYNTDGLGVTQNGTIHALSGFASSGTMLCDSHGRLMFVLVARTLDRKWSPLSCYVCYSDDAGASWHINPVAVDTDGDESKITQLADGSLLMSIRNRHKGSRKLYRSTDRGATWSGPELPADLYDPACNGDMITLRNGHVIHSLAADSTARRNVSIVDGGIDARTWQPVYSVCPTPSGYSALVELPDGGIGCLCEESAIEGGYRLWFTRFPAIK